METHQRVQDKGSNCINPTSIYKAIYKKSIFERLEFSLVHP